MKKEIAAYITAMINNYEMTIDMIDKGRGVNSNKPTYEGIIGRLQGLLDFIDDIPEEGQADVERLKRENMLLNGLIDLLVNGEGVIEYGEADRCCKN